MFVIKSKVSSNKNGAKKFFEKLKTLLLFIFSFLSKSESKSLMEFY